MDADDAALWEPVLPAYDGTLATAREAAVAYASRAKADNTRRPYRAGVRACVATVALRRAAIRYLVRRLRRAGHQRHDRPLHLTS